MNILDSTSLMKTLDNINEKLLFGEAITPEEWHEAAQWIISRQGKKGSYRDMFAPTQSDFEQGIRLFTGEKLISASARHIMGQEASRAVWLLANQDPIVRDAYDRATGWMREEPDFQQSGTYCCGRCTLAFWRHFMVGNFEHKEGYILKGLQRMKGYRLGDGKWHYFPFFYAVYTLVDLDLEPALAELKYARPVMEQYLKNTRVGAFSKRRITIINKALENIN
jgi:hypothetical protein